MPVPLDTLLVDPETKEPVRRASAAEIEAIREAIRERRARRHGGGELPRDVDGAYVSHDGRWIYPDTLGFPSFVVEDRLELDAPIEARPPAEP